MLNKKYLHFGFNFDGLPPIKELEHVFNLYGDDWIRYSSNCWLAWTKNDQELWLKSIKPLLRSNDHVLILEVQQDQKIGGWLPQWIWDWLYKQRK